MRHIRTKISVLLLMIGIFLSGDFVLAQQAMVIDQTTMTMDIANIVDLIIGILSWWWVLLANLAGKLMTNQFVYGEFINLDVILYQMWNVAKNFANFGLGFFFIYQIFSYFFGEEQGLSKIWSVLSKIIIAAVGIQMSWFLVAAVLDISTVLTTAISAFPNTILQQSFEDQNQLINSIKEVPTKVTLKTQWWTNDRSLAISTEKLKDTDLSSEEYLDFIVPSADDLSGPLYYIGFSALRIQDYMTLTLDSPSGEKPVSLLVTTFLKFGILLFFSIALIIFVILNIFRIMYLWLFIAFVPILVLLWAVGKEDAISQSLSHFNIGEILKLIFTPAMYTAYLGITLIAIVTMQRVILDSTALNADNCNQNIKWVSMCYDNVSKSSSISIDQLNSWVTIEWELFPPGFQDGAANIFTSMLLSIFTLLMLWGLVKLMSTSWSSVGRWSIQNVTETAKTVVGSVPLVPIAGWQSLNSLRSAWSGIAGGIKSSADKRRFAQEQNFEDKLNRFLGNGNTDMLVADKRSLETLASSDKDISWWTSKFLDKANSIITQLPEYSLTTSSKSIINDLNTWFVNNKSSIATISDFKNNSRLQNAFNNSKDISSISEFVDIIADKTDRQFFLSWLHKKIGGEGWTMSTWKEFVAKPIKPMA